jgi:hypothetical protein
MHYAPRTIALLTELIHQPLAPDPAAIQRIHNDLFQAGSPAYQNFHALPQGAVLSNPVTRPGAVSTAEFLPDRMRFREELTAVTQEDFASRVADLALRAAQSRGLQQFSAQAVIVRTLVNPRNYSDSREFLRESMLGMRAETAVFERDPALYGLRLAFPPSPAEPNAFTLRIESYAGDPRSIFLENQGTFGPIPVADGADAPRDNVDGTYRFLVSKALAFLSQFDVRLEA